MAENNSAVVATTVDNTIDTNKDSNMIVTSKKNRMSNSDRMPPVINWSNVSSDTKVTNSVRGASLQATSCRNPLQLFLL